MAVGLNVKGETGSSSPSSPLTQSVTVVGTANRVVIGVFFANGSGGTVSATFAGNAMTALGDVATAGNRFAYLFALKGDASIPTGSQTFSVTYSGTPGDAGVGVAVFDGADQTTGWQNYIEAGPTTGTDATITVTSASGNMVFGAEVDDNASGRTINGGTQDWAETALDGNYLGSHRASVSGSTVLGWTLGSSVSWTMAAVDIIAAAGGGGGSAPSNPSTLTLTGVQ